MIVSTVLRLRLGVKLGWELGLVQPGVLLEMLLEAVRRMKCYAP
jgi:hypothetical protein